MKEELNLRQIKAINLYIADGMRSREKAMQQAGYSASYSRKLSKTLFEGSEAVRILKEHTKIALNETKSDIIDIIKNLSTINSIEVPALYIADDDYPGLLRCKTPTELTSAERKAVKKITEKKIDVYEFKKDLDTGKSIKTYVKTVQRFNYELYDRFAALEMMTKIQGLYKKPQDLELEESEIAKQRDRMKRIPSEELRKQLDSVERMMNRQIDKEKDDEAVDAEFKEVKSG